MPVEGFLGLHADIILELALYLELDDIFSLFATCRNLRELSEARFPWIKILEQMSARQPLPCPLGQDLSLLDLPDLFRIARHSNRLEKNWNSLSPSLVGQPHLAYSSPGCPLEIVSVMYGTNSILLYSRMSRKLTYLDYSTHALVESSCIGHLHIVDARYRQFKRTFFTIGTSEFDEPEATDLDVYCVDQRGEQATMTRTFHFKSPAPFCDVFLYDDVVGTITRLDEYQVQTRAINMTTGSSVTIISDVHHSMGHDSTLYASIYCGCLYVIFPDTFEQMWYTYHFTPDALPYGPEGVGNPKAALIFDACLKPTGDLSTFEPINTTSCISGWVSSGVVSMFIRWRGSLSTRLCLWNSKTTKDPHNPLEFSEACAEITLNRLLQVDRSTGFWLQHIPFSGLNTLLVTLDENNMAMHLLRFGRSPVSISTHNLDIPLDLLQTYSILLDDHLGRVFLSQRDGSVWVLSYG